MYTCSEERMADKIKTFSAYGDPAHGGITRYSMSPEMWSVPWASNSPR